MQKILRIFLNALPALIMIGLIPIVANDYLLTAVYIAIIIISLAIKRERNNLLVLAVGFGVMTVSEYLFISTDVETFVRHSLFGVMPLWLPFLWAYGFVAIKRSTEIINAK